MRFVSLPDGSSKPLRYDEIVFNCRFLNEMTFVWFSCDLSERNIDKRRNKEMPRNL